MCNELSDVTVITGPTDTNIRILIYQLNRGIKADNVQEQNTSSLIRSRGARWAVPDRDPVSWALNDGFGFEVLSLVSLVSRMCVTSILNIIFFIMKAVCFQKK